MQTKPNIVVLILALVIAVFIPLSGAHATPSPNDSLLKFESSVMKGWPTNGNCVSRGLVITNIATINSNGSYGFGSSLGVWVPNSSTEWYKQLKLRMENHMASSVAGVKATSLFGFASDADTALMESACRSAFVFQPYEYYSWFTGNMTCKASGSSIINTNPNAPTASIIPYFYHCDPYYDPVTGAAVASGATDNLALIGRTQGYIGAQSSSCTGSNAQLANKFLVGRIVVGYYPEPGFNAAMVANKYTPCSQTGIQTAFLKPGEAPQKVGDLEMIAYIDEVNKGQICAATVNTLYPIFLGCTPYSPPASASAMFDLWGSTSCHYLQSPRSDLHALASTLSLQDDDNFFGKSVKDFLASDMHPISTVVSCIKDVMNFVMVGTPTGTIPQASYYSVIQSKLKGIVLGVLVLYVCMVGINIMLHYNELTKGKLIMFVLKFALVYYFTLGDIWGILFPQIMQVSDDIMQIFSMAQQSNDFTHQCSYKYQGSEILSDRTFGAIQNQYTLGQIGVIKLSIWDYMDCKLMNYINLGSCIYDPLNSFLILVLGIFCGLLSGLLAIGIILIIYIVMIFKMLFQFVQIAILSLFTVCILVFLSPIFISFALFEATKSIYEGWFRALFGYLLYPPLMFVFMTLVFLTFDSVYYGEIDMTKVSHDVNGGPLYSRDATGTTTNAACTGVNSPFCVTATAFESDSNGNAMSLCYNTGQTIFEKVGRQFSIPFLGNFYTAETEFYNTYFFAALRMMLWAYLFSIFANIFSEFSARMLNITSFGMQLHKGMIGGSIAGAGFASIFRIITNR